MRSSLTGASTQVRWPKKPASPQSMFHAAFSQGKERGFLSKILSYLLPKLNLHTYTYICIQSPLIMYVLSTSWVVFVQQAQNNEKRVKNKQKKKDKIAKNSRNLSVIHDSKDYYNYRYGKHVRSTYIQVQEAKLKLGNTKRPGQSSVPSIKNGSILRFQLPLHRSRTRMARSVQRSWASKNISGGGRSIAIINNHRRRRKYRSRWT